MRRCITNSRNGTCNAIDLSMIDLRKTYIYSIVELVYFRKDAQIYIYLVGTIL